MGEKLPGRKVSLTLSRNPYNCRVEVDGVELSRVTSCKVFHDCGDLPKVLIEMVPEQVCVSGDGFAVKERFKK